MTQSKKVWTVLGLNSSMVIALILVGLSTHSLGVLAAGGDYLADISALLFGLISIAIRDRKSGNSKATTIAAIINSASLLLISAGVIWAALNRLIHHTPEIHGLPVLIVSALAAVVMALGAFIVQDEDDLHMKSIFLDSLADAISAAAVAASGAIILLTNGWYWLDSATALTVSALIAFQAAKLLSVAVRTINPWSSNSAT